MKLVDGTAVSKGLVAAVVLLAFSSRSWSQCGGQAGQETWSTPPYDWTTQMVFVDTSGTKCIELEISHAALIPRGVFRGKVLLWRKERTNTPTTGCQDADTDVTWIFDPGDPTPTLGRINQTLSSDIFCGGLTFDRFGQLIVSGGVPTPECLPDDCEDQGCALPAETYRFQPQQLEGGLTPGGQVVITSNPWKKQGPMVIRRYYPTNITLNKVQLFRSDDFEVFGQPVGGVEDEPLPLSATMVAGGPACGGGMGNEFWELLPPANTGTTQWLPPFLPQDPTGVDPDYSPQKNSPHYGFFVQPDPMGPAGPYDPYERPEGLQNPEDKDTAEPVLDSYPRMFQTSFNGQILVCGDVDTLTTGSPPTAEGSVWVIKPRVSDSIGSPAYWQELNGPIGAANWHGSFYDTAVLLHELPPSTRDRVLMFGGSRDDGGWTVNDKVWEFDKNEAVTNDQIVSGAWVEKTDGTMFKRLYPNAVVLPTGDIFIEGGTSNDDFTGHCSPSATPPGCMSAPVYTPIIYDPGNPDEPGTVHVQDAPPILGGMMEATARLYHHIALLLPDGRVFMAGGRRPKDSNGVVLSPTQGYPDPRFSGEVFSPPYLDLTGLGRTRPRFETPLPPSEILFGNSFDVTVRHTDGMDIDRIVLLRPAAVTHHWDADQRYIELDFFLTGSAGTDGTDVIDTYSVQAPDTSLGPAGYYMLFVVEDDLTGSASCTTEGHRIPSVAHFINIQ